MIQTTATPRVKVTEKKSLLLKVSTAIIDMTTWLLNLNWTFQLRLCNCEWYQNEVKNDMIFSIDRSRFLYLDTTIMTNY